MLITIIKVFFAFLVRFLFVREERSGIPCGQGVWGTHRQATLLTHKKETHPYQPTTLTSRAILVSKRSHTYDV